MSELIKVRELSEYIMPLNKFETPRQPPAPPTEPSGELRAAVERWAAQQPDKPTLTEALRRLVERGLATD